MYLFYFLQEAAAPASIWDSIVKLQSYILIVVGFVIAVILLRTGIPDRLASGWEKVSGMQDKERTVVEREIKQLKEQKIIDDAENARQKAQIVDLTREVDVRREINRQDSEIIKGMKLELTAFEDKVSNLRAEIREFEKTGVKGDGK